MTTTAASLTNGTITILAAPLHLVEQRIGDGCDYQRQHQHQGLTAHHDPTNGVVGGRTHALRDHERYHARHERQRRHQTRPQPIAAGLHDRVVRGEAGRAQLIGMSDLEREDDGGEKGRRRAMELA